MEKIPAMREKLIPRKVPKLNENQKKGKNLLDIFDAYRKSKIREIEAEENALRAELKDLSRKKSEFGCLLKQAVPEYAEVLKARQTELTGAERKALLTKYHSTPPNALSLSEEAYLAASRQNKRQKAERNLYRTFLRLDSKAHVHELVDKLYNAAGNPGGAAAESPSTDAKDDEGIDDIAPNM